MAKHPAGSTAKSNMIGNNKNQRDRLKQADSNPALTAVPISPEYGLLTWQWHSSTRVLEGAPPFLPLGAHSLPSHLGLFHRLSSRHCQHVSVIHCTSSKLFLSSAIALICNYHMSLLVRGLSVKDDRNTCTRKPVALTTLPRAYALLKEAVFTQQPGQSVLVLSDCQTLPSLWWSTNITALRTRPCYCESWSQDSNSLCVLLVSYSFMSQVMTSLLQTAFKWQPTKLQAQILSCHTCETQVTLLIPALK